MRRLLQLYEISRNPRQISSEISGYNSSSVNLATSEKQLISFAELLRSVESICKIRFWSGAKAVQKRCKSVHVMWIFHKCWQLHNEHLPRPLFCISIMRCFISIPINISHDNVEPDSTRQRVVCHSNTIASEWSSLK